MKGYIKPRDRRKNRKGPCRVWQLVVHLGYDDQKKRKTLYRTFQGKKSDAQVALDELKAQVRSGGFVRGDHTFTYALERWLAVKRNEASSGDPPPIDIQTVDQYQDYARIHLLPQFATRKLRDIQDFEIKEFVENLRLRGRKAGGQTGQGLSISTVRRLRFVLNSVFEYACDMGWTPRNVVARVKLPRQTSSTEYRILDDDEARRLVEASKGTRLHLVIFIAAVTGARRGEILALIWDDFDFDALKIRVRRALRHNATTKRPKSKSGVRVLDMPEELALQLLAYKEKQDEARKAYGDSYDDRGFVFAEPDGRPWKPNSISTLYRRIVRDAGIGKVKLHELRHSLASILIANGVDLATVAKILGHADKSFTARQYVHASGINDSKAQSVIARRAAAASGQHAATYIEDRG